MISYFFPPEGSAGVYRPLRFVRQLTRMGWKTTVVTVQPYRHERFDSKLLMQVPRETEIIPVKVCDPWLAFQAWRGKNLEKQLSDAPPEILERLHVAQHTSFRSKVREIIRIAEAYYYFPDFAKPWIRPAIRQTSKLIARNPHQVLWATIGPVSAGVVAQHASQFTKIPYVLDFRDPWELYYYESENVRPKRLTFAAQRTLYSLFERARSVVFLFSRMAECYLRAYRGALDPAKIHIIPNGYEGNMEKFRVPDCNRCTVLYAGTLSSYRYDTLLQAIQTLKIQDPIVASQLRISFVGDGMMPLVRMAESLNVSDVVQTAPPVPYDEVKRLNDNAHAFLILGRSPDRKGHELVAGAKLFGYFKARKPIVGVLPYDETKAILSSVGVETLADSDSVPNIVQILKRVHECWAEGNLESLLPNVRACQKFNSESQTVALIRALEGFPPEEPFEPGKIDLPESLRPSIEDQRLWYRPDSGVERAKS